MTTEIRVYEKEKGGMELVSAVKQANGYWALGPDELYVKEETISDRLRGYKLIFTQVMGVK